jgi:hypothetical protein
MLIELEQLTARSMGATMAQQRKLDQILRKKKLDALKKTYRLDEDVEEDHDHENCRFTNSSKVGKKLESSEPKT